MKVRVADPVALERVQARTLRIYLASHGWQRSGDGFGLPWTYGEGSYQYEVLPPSSEQVPDFSSRVSETLRVLAVVEDRSELEVLRDLFQSRYDIQQHKLDFDGPLGTAPLADASLALRAAQSALVAAAASLRYPDRQIYPIRPEAEVTNLSQSALAGPISEGSFQFTVWTPVPPRLVPEEDLVLFEIEDEPFERAATFRLYTAMSALREAVSRVEQENLGIEAFTDRLGEGVTAALCEAVSNIMNESRIGLETSFSWSLDRPLRLDANAVRFPRGSRPILEEAARSIRNLIPEEEVLIVGNVVRLFRTTEEGDGEVTIAGTFSGDVEERFRRVTMSLPSEDYESAIRAHDDFNLVQVVGELYRRGNRQHLRNPRNFTRLATDVANRPRPRSAP
ncbi:MAG: hypothetical protein ACREX3_23700 [Gammaproteobacteria bacterium]